jgi:hypothetical protein
MGQEQPSDKLVDAFELIDLPSPDITPTAESERLNPHRLCGYVAIMKAAGIRPPKRQPTPSAFPARYAPRRKSY